MSGKLEVKRTLAALYGRLPRSATRRIVLLYHSLGSSPFALSKDEFRRQIAWLAQAAQVASLDEVIAGTGSAPLQVAITFDDGYASLYAAVMPILSEFGATATVFLTTGYIGTDSRQASNPARGHYPNDEFLMWSEVEALVAAGWNIAPHGVEHLDLTVQSDDRICAELSKSRLCIESRLGKSLPIFAYPWGRHSTRVRKLAAQMGYDRAMAGIHGPVTGHSDPYAIPRIDIARGYTLDDFKAIVRGDWDYLGWLQRARALARS